MLMSKDIHIDQIGESLKGALVYGLAALEKADIAKDFDVLGECPPCKHKCWWPRNPL